MDFVWFFYFLAKHPFWSQVLISSIGAFVGFIFALGLYYWRQQEDKSKERRKASETNKRINKHHNSLVNSVIEITEKQIQSIKDYEEKQKVDFIEYQQPRLFTTQHFQRLIMISKDVFYSLEAKYRDDKWMNNLKDLHKEIDFLEGAFKELFRIVSETGREYFENYKEVKKLVDNSADDLSRLQLALKHELGEFRSKNAVYVFVDKYIYIYMQIVKEKKNLSYINENYLRSFLKEYRDNYTNVNLEIDRIAFNMKKARITIGTINQSNLGNYEQFRIIAQLLIDVTKKVKEVNNQLFCKA